MLFAVVTGIDEVSLRFSFDHLSIVPHTDSEDFTIVFFLKGENVYSCLRSNIISILIY